MSTITLTNLQAALLDRTGITSTDSLITSAAQIRLINRALWQVCLERDWPWLHMEATLSTVVADVDYAVPTGFLRLVSLTHQDTGEPLSRRHIKLLDRMPTTITGRPMIYAIDTDEIHVRWAPDAVYSLTHRYIRTEPALAAGSDTALIPQEFSQGPIEWAAVKVFSMKKDMPRAQEAKADYNAWIDRCADNINASREPLSMTSRPGSYF